MPDPDHERRISALESRMDQVAAAARHLAAAGDRDLADLGAKVDANGRAIADLEVKVDANRAAVNALGVQTAGRFDQVDRRFDQVDERLDRLETEMRTGFAVMDAGFIQIRGTLDQTAAGLQRIVELITESTDGDE